MAKVHFNLDSKKYIMEFLPDNQVKIIQTGNEDRVITVQYFSDTKVTDFMRCIKSWDFSKLRDKTLYIQSKGKNCRVSQAEKGDKMKKMFWCVHHIIIDSDGYYESIKACSSKEKAEKIAKSISKGKIFIRFEEKEI